MTITGVVVRRRVRSLDDAVPFYERLTGEPGRRFSFGDAELCAVGPFLLFSADGEVGDRLERVVATVTVADLDDTLARLTALGADTVAPPAGTPNGRRTVVRHPDGGFRRLRIVQDGRGLVSADGAEEAKLVIIDKGLIEVTVGDDRYRLPATVAAKPN